MNQFGFNTYIHGNVTGKLCTAILNKQKCYFFFFYKIREQKGRTGPVWGTGASGKGEDVGKGCRRVNMAQILYIHICKWKNETC
jgi:hypothetical protein